MAVAVPVKVGELLPRLQTLLHELKATCDAAPTAENRASLTMLEEIVEDLLDMQEAQEALEEMQQLGGASAIVSWDAVKKGTRSVAAVRALQSRPNTRRSTWAQAGSFRRTTADHFSH